jgi:hypothetical protein
MQTYSHPIHLKITLPILAGIAVIWGGWLSFVQDDPHWLNRSGALVAGIAAAAVLLQLRAEMQVETEREHLATKMNSINQDATVTTPLDELEIRLALNRIERGKAQLSRRRLAVAAFVVSGAMLGELLHGFGDLLMCFSFGVCAERPVAGAFEKDHVQRNWAAPNPLRTQSPSSGVFLCPEGHFWSAAGSGVSASFTAKAIGQAPAGIVNWQPSNLDQETVVCARDWLHQR